MSLNQPPDPNLYQLMPPLDAEQYAQLKEDIRHKGVIQPIVFDEKGNIVDGHHRFRAFSELLSEGVDVPMFNRLVLNFNDEQQKIEYVLSLNVKRRHMTREQRRDLVVKLRRKPYAYTMQKIADLLNIGVSTVYWDLQDLPDEMRAELQALSVTGADGKVRPASYVIPTYSTGYNILREMQQKQADAAAKAVAHQHTVVAVSAASEAPPPPKVVQHTEPADDIADAERMNAFSWYGGKTAHLKWMLPLLPAARHFVDVFGGSGTVLMNREPSPIETYNDLDNSVVNFFAQLRDSPDALIKLIALTPYSREERRIAYNTSSVEFSTFTNLERARRFFVLARQSRSGLAQKSAGMLNSWRFTRDLIRKNMAAYVADWQSAIDGLAAVAARLRNVQIENYPAIRAIELYDTADTLFYCDPPYVHDTRRHDKRNVYAFEMTDEQHRELASALHSVKGKVALSGYPSELYDTLYADWHRFMMPVSATAGSAGGEAAERIEVLWTNYSITGS